MPDQHTSQAMEKGVHPDKAFSHYILQGLEQGFRVGFEYTSNLIPSKRNMLSAAQHREVVSDYLGEELALNSFPSQSLQLGVHCIPLGVIPKRHKPNKWTCHPLGVPVLTMELTRRCAAYLTPQLTQLLREYSIWVRTRCWPS